MLKGLSGLTSMLKQAQEMGGRMQGMQEDLRGKSVTGSAGGGMVEVEMNGAMEMLNCRLEEQLVTQGDRELIEDLVTTAVNQAVTKSKELHTDAMKSLTGDMNIPGLDSALGDILGDGEATPE